MLIKLLSKGNRKYVNVRFNSQPHVNIFVFDSSLGLPRHFPTVSAKISASNNNEFANESNYFEGNYFRSAKKFFSADSRLKLNGPLGF